MPASLSLIDGSGFAIILIIVAILVVAASLTFYARARYAEFERELSRQVDGRPEFRASVLSQIARAVETAAGQRQGEINTQAIVEHHFQSELGGLLVAERFVKSATGLMIIMGLIGTFYGLTMSIGKLVALVAGDSTAVTDVTTSVTTGLTQALAGMSVAFSTSLFGIAGAIVMTLLNVVVNVPARRSALTLRLENYLDHELLPALRGGHEARDPAPGAMSIGFEHAVSGFRRSVAELDATVARFETALQGFSTSTRDFREFNLHLKDNIQRMSLSFVDVSDALAQHVARLDRRDGR